MSLIQFKGLDIHSYKFSPINLLIIKVKQIFLQFKQINSMSLKVKGNRGDFD
jgi:hypothetical protein